MNMRQVVGQIFRSLIGVLGVIVATVNAPLFLVKNRSMFSNPIFYVFWHCSFGQGILDLDYAARLYYPHRYLALCFEHNISLIYMPDPRSSQMDTFILKKALMGGFQTRQIASRPLRWHIRFSCWKVAD